jgi:proteasome lid subunit RPN8/RPN11
MPNLLQIARWEPERECCGLLAGRDATVTRVLPATNEAANPAIGYEIAPQELFRMIREIRAAGLDLMGIYHSHPNSKNEPSSRDIELAYYPDVAYFIISPRADAARPIRAFSIREGHASEMDIRII